MNPLACAPERCFAAILALRAAPSSYSVASPLDLAGIVRQWPHFLAMRFVSGLPTDCAVASLQALPNRFETARVGQLLRVMALDKVADSFVGRALSALAEVNFARAATLRRDMEWEAQDAVFFPADCVLPGEELPLHLAVLADKVWDDLSLPCIHRLPAPEDHPDTWPEPAAAVSLPELPESIPSGSAWNLRAGIEWLHLWRLDAALAEAVWHAVPAAQTEEWIAALLDAIRPDNTQRLPYDLVALEHAMDEHEGILSQLEVDALLRGVCEPPEKDGSQFYSEEARRTIQNAVTGWLERAGGWP